MKNLFMNDGIGIYINKIRPSIIISLLIIIAYVYIMKDIDAIPIVSMLVFTFILLIISIYFETRAVNSLNQIYHYTEEKISFRLVFKGKINLFLANIIVTLLCIVPILGFFLGLASFLFSTVLFEQYHLRVIKTNSLKYDTQDLLPAINTHFRFCIRYSLFTFILIFALFGMLSLILINPFFVIFTIFGALLIEAYQSAIKYSYYMQNETVNQEKSALNNDNY